MFSGSGPCVDCHSPTFTEHKFKTSTSLSSRGTIIFHGLSTLIFEIVKKGKMNSINIPDLF